MESYVARKAKPQLSPQEDVRIQEFLDIIAPYIIKFSMGYFICGNTFRYVWALREYPI